ncbi:MAG: gliding motility protein GldL [Duncaniella sp.]|nr:gliding motility protein GldL [Duncaniella sp.]
MSTNQIKDYIQTMLTWEGGQRLFNFAYSIGAAIVIWGALFKILHLPGGNTLLCIGMGTEVLMFIISAFDRPPKEYKWEDVFPELDGGEPSATGSRPAQGGSVQVVSGTPVQSAEPLLPGLSPAASASLTDSISRMSAAADQMSQLADLATATQTFLSQMTAIADSMTRLQATTEQLNAVSSTLLQAYSAISQNSDAVSENSRGYVSSMADLNRNIGGLNTIYEIQLKSVATQLDSIDRVNRGIKDIRDMYEKSASQSARYYEETEKMARNMQQLNSVYEKMLSAMTANMYRPGASVQP